ncbi:hypothetical protein D3C72_2229860 [compost metagenome]
MFWTISGWLIALLALIVNYLQLQQNNGLKEQLNKLNQNVRDNSSANQQTHSGQGHNINIGGNAHIG